MAKREREELAEETAESERAAAIAKVETDDDDSNSLAYPKCGHVGPGPNYCDACDAPLKGKKASKKAAKAARRARRSARPPDPR